MIGFEPVLSTHTDQNLADIVERVLTENGLLADLLAITTDNAGNNNMMRTELTDALKQLHNVKWNKEYGTIPCLAHILQLMVKKLVSLLKIEIINKSKLTSFDENEVS